MLEIRRDTIFAKVLAQEDINITVSKTETAYFDLKKRLLVLPNWEASEDLYNLLISHEVSHAIFTPAKRYVDQIRSKPESLQEAYGTVLNLCEDCRIDKLIQRRYPGTKRWYYLGMEELIERDFFGINDEEMNDLSIFDRLNVHFKTEFLEHYPIEFTDFEYREYVVPLQNVESFDDVIEIAEKLFNQNKEEIENNAKNDQKECSSNYESEENEETEEKASSSSAIFKTIQNLENQLKSLVNKTTIREDLFLEEYSVKKFVLEFQPDFEPKPTLKNDNDQELVNVCVSQFEKRKRAREYGRIREAKTGIINTNKLYNYKITENLFLEKQIEHNHQNHGMIMLIDCSYSMQPTFNKVVRQTQILSLFCLKQRIPFEVYGFTDNAKYTQKKCQNIYHLGKVTLLKFCDSNQPKIQINRLNRDVSTTTITLSDTPLSAALVVSRHVIEEFREKYPVDILNFVVLTDGGCNKTLDAEYFVTDKKTRCRIKTGISFAGYDDYTSALFQIIKERTGARTIAFFIKDEETRDVNNVIIQKNVGGVDYSQFVDSSVIFEKKNRNTYILQQFINLIS